jgi:hypothetical protein
VIPLGHIAGVPVEEFLPALGTTGASLLLARAWLAAQFRREDRRERERRRNGEE